MSENIPTEANSSNWNATTSKKLSKKIKYDKIKLPTPPPDPTTSKGNKEKDVFDYLEALIPNYSRSTSTFAPVIATDEAFDHLEKLYKLMEQMLELREQNAKLHRRIRDLEHLNNLEKMQKQLKMSEGEECPELEKDTAFAETILESILADSSRKDHKQKIMTPTRLRPSILRKQRDYSGSAGTDKQVTLDANAMVQHEDGYTDHDKSAKVSKWTKVKAAFRWEKASSTVGDNKSQDSGIHVPVNVEIARYLRVPSTSDDTGHSPADSGAAGISTPGSLSTTSSTEDFHRLELRAPCEDFRSSEDEHSQHNYIPHSKDEHSKSHLRNHRSPWEKVKGIIPTRNSFKKKHRLSAASDDIQIDIEPCSDEEVFEDEPKNKFIQISSQKRDSNEIPEEVIERYQNAIAENLDRDTSKWAMIKKAFLTNENQARSCPASPKGSTLEDEIQRDYKKLQKKLSIEFQEKFSEWERLKQNSPGASNSSSACGFVEESKDPNFLKKMEEWQKIKSQHSICKSPMPSEIDLPPDFKKKLQEWEKIKKSSGKESSGVKKKLGEVGRWKSLSGHRTETSTAFEYPPLSEDFRKKLDEWKQIKAAGCGTSNLVPAQVKQKDKTPSPKLVRKNSSPRHSKKNKDTDKELHWVEKELNKIEKEKQRLERERQKFLEREERLSKLRKSVVGGNKKEVLIHLASGFYRFEGISRKFTQKLYEWEKAKGITPEASTFALLSSSYTADNKPTNKRHSATNTPPLIRSMSADSIAISALNLTCPLMTHQPSSLSLNDVEELEKECLADSKSSSIQYLLDSEEALEIDEPEAVLVEVEDYEEETAGPLQTFVEKHQLPIYQRQEVKALCEGETIAAPKVRRSESTRAQVNYNLIEDITKVLKQLAENEVEVKNLGQGGVRDFQNSEAMKKLEVIYRRQKEVCSILLEKLQCLQEVNISVTSTISTGEGSSQTYINDTLEAIQDLSYKMIQMAEKMDQHFSKRNPETLIAHRNYLYIFENIRDVRSKILELRRHLSYVCAATDITAPKKLGDKNKIVVHKTISNESKSSRCDTSDNSRRGSQREEKRYVKMENISSTNSHSQGAVKKRIKYRQKVMQNRSLPDTDDEEEVEAMDQRKNSRQHKKLTRARTISEGSVPSPVVEPEAMVMEPEIIVPTETNYVSVIQEEPKFPPESPLTVFVKTTRKLFTPIGETGLTDTEKSSPNFESPSLELDPAKAFAKEPEANVKKEEKYTLGPIKFTNPTQENVKTLPPLPQSPVPQRKVFKEVSPSIRLMLAKYNQKITEQEIPTTKSGNSSGSNSPIAWRSPVSERRVKAQTEKYQEELTKMSPLSGGRREIQKSSSVSYLSSGCKQYTIPTRRDSVQDSLLCNQAASTCDRVSVPQESVEHSKKNLRSERKLLTLEISPNSNNESNRHSPEIRQKKLQKAKEEFLRSTPVSAPAYMSNEEVIKFPTRNRLSQVSVDSESSYDSTLPGTLIKSASVGMINIDPDTYRQIDPELHGGGYVSLPRNTSNPKGNKFGFSNIASKFRKVRMRKGKERDRNKENMNTVSTLCRHSLVVDITKVSMEDGRTVEGEESGLPPDTSIRHNCNSSNNNNNQQFRREDSPSSSSSTAKGNISWLKKSLFKK